MRFNDNMVYQQLVCRPTAVEFRRTIGCIQVSLQQYPYPRDQIVVINWLKLNLINSAVTPKQCH